MITTKTSKQVARIEAAVMAVASVYNFPALELLSPENNTRAKTVARDVLALVLLTDLERPGESVRSLMGYSTPQGPSFARQRLIQRMHTDPGQAKRVGEVRTVMRKGGA